MKLLTGIALTAAGFYILSKLTAAGVASRLNLLISNFNLSINGIVPIVTLNVTAQNVTNDSLQFNALIATAYLNGTPIGNVSGFTPVNITPMSQVNIPLVIQVNAAALLSDVVSILSGTAGISATIEVKGTANISNLILPVDLIYKAL